MGEQRRRNLAVCGLLQVPNRHRDKGPALQQRLRLPGDANRARDDSDLTVRRGVWNDSDFQNSSPI